MTTGTRTGAAYEQCKSVYFACMDQFCTIKNASYQRCSCSDRIYDITAAQGVMQDAGAHLTTFTENLDVVGLSAAQAAAMRKASEGELALTGDKSASKALLQAIMNSIKGESTSVGGAYEGLNTINIRLDDSAGFGYMDSGQAIASYNGKNLYTAIYGKCREAVRDDCTDASLQRAVTAYLMAVEQDCNTVQKQLDDMKKKMTAAVREGSAMLDLARVKDRQERNSSDATACLHNVEKAVLSEEVCGAGYRRCLDNGKYIDVTTGRPMEGVVEFYRLQELLAFSKDISLGDQKLARIPANRTFVTAFEKKVRQFAQPALDKCVEIADQVWADYLDKAMLEIYYAQREKVAEIKLGCMDFVSACYMNGSKAITAAMSGIISGSIGMVPGTIELLDATCSKYVAACDHMFCEPGESCIIAQYIENRKNQDLTDSCRAVVKQCFDDFGGVAYSNFYNPVSGIFSTGHALDWFTFRGYDKTKGDWESEPISPCAKRLLDVSACDPKNEDGDDDKNPHKFARSIFGGFDRFYPSTGYPEYGLHRSEASRIDPSQMYKSGVATEIYNQIANSLSADCQNYGGRFVQKRFLDQDSYPRNQQEEEKGFCSSNFNALDINDEQLLMAILVVPYRIGPAGCAGDDCDGKENFCPMNYWRKVDTLSWGVCNCWENGGRRSDDGRSLKCVPGRFYTTSSSPAWSDKGGGTECVSAVGTPPANCERGVYRGDKPKDKNKICPFGANTDGTCKEGTCTCTPPCLCDTEASIDLILEKVPEAIY